MWGVSGSSADAVELRAALECPSCEDLLHIPVTLECGHTMCRACVAIGGPCTICGAGATPGAAAPRPNVLVQGLVDRLTANDVNTPASSHSGVSVNAKLRRKWNRAHRRRDHQVHVKESIGAYCLATICDSQNRSFSHIVSKVIHNLMSTKRHLRSRCQPYPSSRPNGPHRSIPASDYEDLSSSDDDHVQGIVSTSDLRRLVEKIVRELDRVRKPPNTHYAERVVSSTELGCVLCSRCLLEPVTTACGHTFCRECLERVLDYGHSCPLCVAPISRFDLSRGSTIVIEQLLHLVLPTEYNERILTQQNELHTLDSQVPVFICTTAFPGVACPLFVYEPRYRLLTRRCLQSQTRRFAMASAGTQANERFAKYGTMLEVKDSVRMQDGCSILTTIGMRRFRVLETSEKDGYDTASVQYIQDSPVPSSQLALLNRLHDQVYMKAKAWVHSLNPNIQAEIEQSFGAMPSPEPNWHRLPDGPTWAWWLMAILPLGVQLQVGILGTTSLEKRLRAIDKTLEHVSARMNAIQENKPISREGGEEIADTCSGTHHNHHRQRPQEPTQSVQL